MLTTKQVVRLEELAVEYRTVSQELRDALAMIEQGKQQAIQCNIRHDAISREAKEIAFTEFALSGSAERPKE